MTALDIAAAQAYEAHPVADLFPMLADDELAGLADDIAQRGQLQPIVLDSEGRVLDGRNRLQACHLAGVEPRFETYDGDDPEGFALAANGLRRDLTKSKRAIAASQARSLVPKEWGGQTRLAKILQVSEALVSQANSVIQHAPDLAGSVRTGATSLDKAYEQARANKRQADSVESKMLRLRNDAPDLAEKVTEGDLELDDAVAALDERKRKAAEQQRDARALLGRIADLTVPANSSADYIDAWNDHLGEMDDDLSELCKHAEQAAQVLLDLTERIRDK